MVKLLDVAHGLLERVGKVLGVEGGGDESIQLGGNLLGRPRPHRRSQA